MDVFGGAAWASLKQHDREARRVAQAGPSECAKSTAECEEGVQNDDEQLARLLHARGDLRHTEQVLSTWCFRRSAGTVPYLLYLLPPDPQNHQKITSRERCCDNFAAIFAPRSPTGTPFAKKIISEKVDRPATNIFFQTVDLILGPSPIHKDEMTANGFSSYEVFVKLGPF